MGFSSDDRTLACLKCRAVLGDEDAILLLSLEQDKRLVQFAEEAQGVADSVARLLQLQDRPAFILDELVSDIEIYQRTGRVPPKMLSALEKARNGYNEFGVAMSRNHEHVAEPENGKLAITIFQSRAATIVSQLDALHELIHHELQSKQERS